MTVSLESQKLNEIAASYQEKGYQILQQPTSDRLPRFLEGTQPDLVAQSETDCVVVEIKVGTSQAATGSYQAIADRVRAESGWRFRLVIIDPCSPESLPVDAPILQLPEIEEKLQQVRSLISQKSTDAVVLLEWTVLEAILRLTAQREELPIEEAPMSILAKELYSQGVLTSDDLEKISEIGKIRNGIAHGFRSRANEKTVEDLDEVTERALATLNLSFEEMGAE